MERITAQIIGYASRIQAVRLFVIWASWKTKTRQGKTTGDMRQTDSICTQKRKFGKSCMAPAAMDKVGITLSIY